MSFDNEKILDIIKPEATPEHFKLLPCPFCGSEEVVYIKYQHAVGERWAIMCSGCVVTIDPGYAQQRSTVRDLWNRRTT